MALVSENGHTHQTRRAHSVPAQRDGSTTWSVVVASHGRSAGGGSENGRPTRSEARPLHIVADRPNAESVVLHAHGDITDTNAAELKEMLLSRVRSSVTTVVLDMTQVTFLGVAGLQVLGTMKQCAGLNRTQLVLITESNPAVLRPLRAAAIAGAQVLTDTRS